MKTKFVGFLLVLLAVVFTACGPSPTGETGTEIIEASTVQELLQDPATILIDARPLVEYRRGCVDGALNISRADIVVMEPYSNLLAPATVIEEVMQSRGINNDSLVLIYDDNENMDSARLWWTLKIYGHDNVKVISGGMQALLNAGYTAHEVPGNPIEAGNFTADPLNEEMIISGSEIRAQLDEPEDGFVIIDTRSDEEYGAGHIPGALHVNFLENNFRDGSYRPVSHIQIIYKEAGVRYGDEIVMYCKTSIRGAATYLALYNAGYRNLRLYDGAWLEWTDNPMNPVYVPEGIDVQLRASGQS